MKKTIMALSIALASTSAFAADHVEHIGNQSGKNNDCEVEIENVNGNVTVNGDVYLNGDKVTINGGGSEVYDDSELRDRIEQVNVEDQRVESAELVDGELILTTADMDGDSKNAVKVDLGGLTTEQGDQNASDITDIKTTIESGSLNGVDGKDADYEVVQDMINDSSEVDVWDGEHGATLTDKDGQTVNVASYDDVKDNREAINENTEWDHRQEEKIKENADAIAETNSKVNSNKDKITQVESDYKTADQLIRDDMETANVNQNLANQAARDVIVANQAKIDALQDARMTKAEQELYSTTARSISNENRIGALEEDVKGLRKGIAASAALGFGSNLHTKNHNGNWTLTPSVAHYDGETALAITAQVSVTDNMAVRVGYSNTAQDLLEVDKGIVGAAVTFSFE
ncbi:hypothetical protein KUA24_70 [Vibrio phage HNL01]|nr:hypothetical protein KUA24_70 [Vibrio phage HNL01]